MDFPIPLDQLFVGSNNLNQTGNTVQSLQGSLDGTYLVIGSPFNKLGATDAGAFGVFRRMYPEATFSTMGPVIQASDRAAFNYFGLSIAINSNADYILVGAPGANRGLNSQGTAYLYKKNPTTDQWVSLYQFRGSDLVASDRFGSATAMTPDATYFAVSAPGKDITNAFGTFADAGAIYLYKKRTTTDFWDFLHKAELSVYPIVPQAQLGTGSMQMSWDGSYLMASTDVNGRVATVVFKKDPTTDYWSEITQLIPRVSTSTQRFTMSSNAEYVSVTPATNTPSTFMYKKDAGTDSWSLIQTLTATLGLGSRYNSASMSVNASNLIVGDWQLNSCNGVVGYFTKVQDADTWRFLSSFTVQRGPGFSPRFGQAVQLVGDGSFGIVSAPFQSTFTGGSAVGAVWTYSFAATKQIPSSGEYVVANVPLSGRAWYQLPQVASTQSQTLYIRAAPSNLQSQTLIFSTINGDFVDTVSSFSSIGFETSYQFFSDRVSNWYTLTGSGIPR